MYCSIKASIIQDNIDILQGLKNMVSELKGRPFPPYLIIKGGEERIREMEKLIQELKDTQFEKWGSQGFYTPNLPQWQK